MVYDDRHRTFLQALMQNGAMLDQDATALCVKIFDEKILISLIARMINDKLAPLAMSVKAGICEMTGDKYWSVVGTTHEESVMFPTEFSVAQRAFLRVIYSEIISSEDGCISSTDCLNLSSTIDQKLSMGNADAFLKILTRRRWLYTKDGYIYMGVRSIVELMPYFRATYQDNFHNCSLCREVIFHGQKCGSCDKLFHNYCLARYAAAQKETKCPQCKKPLDTSEIPDEVLASQQTTQQQNDEPMDVEDEDVEDVSEPINNSRRTKKRTRVSSK